LNFISEGNDTNNSVTSTATKKEQKKDAQALLAQQFLVMDLCLIVSCACLIGLAARYVVPSLNNYYNVARFLLRTVNLFFQELIPLASIYFSKDAVPLIKGWFDSVVNMFYKTSKRALAQAK
jgi:hypothetical protein